MLISDLSVLTVCNKTGGTIKRRWKKYYQLYVELQGQPMWNMQERFKTRQTMYKRKILNAFLQPSLQRKSNEYYILWVCVCSFRYPACNGHATYCHQRPARLYTIFPHYKRYDFRKKKLQNKNSGFRFYNHSSVHRHSILTFRRLTSTVVDVPQR